jgi:RNA polymerase sigma factor (sigma-70 family)
MTTNRSVPRLSGPQYGKGNFAVNSRTPWRTWAAVSSRQAGFFLCDFHSGGCYKVNMTPDSELLRRYAGTKSEEAFAELVRRHVNLVYSAALRQVNGDTHLAQDVAQTVFTDLARKAAPLARRSTLTSWLYTSAHFAAAKIARTENRRRDREEKLMREPSNNTAQEVGRVTPCAPDWEKLRPMLDEVMHELKEPDREAILLRYFENRQFAEIGGKLGLNENAARMRVERALEKLRAVFLRRGVAATTALASVISANAVQIAPAGLAATLTSASLAGAGTGTLTFLKLMTMTKLKLGISALVVASATTALVVQHQAQIKLREENQSLRQQLNQLQTDNENLSKQVAAAGHSQSLSDEQLNELLRLRAEASVRRRQNENHGKAQSDAHQARLSQTEANLPAVLDAPTVPLSPAADWANVGNASPTAAMQTLNWAMSKHDENAFSSLVAWDADAKAQAEALFAAAPEAVRQKFGSIDGVLYAMLFGLPPIAGFAVVSQNIQGDEDTLIEQHQYQDGRVRQNQVTLHQFDDGWRIVFGDEKTMRGFDATLKFAAASAGQQP